MRKLLFILMVAFSFALGMVSQNLIAGNWVFPKPFTPAPTLTGNFIFCRTPGIAIYRLPSGWKVLDASIFDEENLSVTFKKLE